MYPDWLPSPLNLRGSYDENIKELLEVFNRDFISSNNPVVDRYRVIVNNNLDPSWQNLQLTYGFTHMITRGSGLRVIDYDRANKLPWVRAILDNYKQPEVTAFWAEHIKGDRLLVARRTRFCGYFVTASEQESFFKLGKCHCDCLFSRFISEF